MIELQSVEKTYPNGFKALTNINLKINQGEFFALLGPSGLWQDDLAEDFSRSGKADLRPHFV